MEELIKLAAYPIRGLIRRLLQDKTTRKNILFASDSYVSYGAGYSGYSQMTENALLGFDSCDIQPRVYKAASEQTERTRKRAEVFTPTWIVKQMCDHCDSVWHESEYADNWQKYVQQRILEITCGEAPFLVTRYDTTTGELLPVAERTGMLDRKLQAVNRHAADEKEWLKWAIRAYESTYGYEFQGDNLLIARINLLVTFCDYLETQWQRKATDGELKRITNIIAWNIWQMDGLNDTPPYGIPSDEIVYCKIYDWRAGISKQFKDLKKRVKGMKFDFVLGNPPYQDNTLGDNTNYAPPIYHIFMDAACSISDKVELIHPARFLFNAGSTPKEWNRKMLNDQHFKVLYYEQDSSKVFSNTDIKGGVVISYRDAEKDCGAIETFTSFMEMNSVLKKIIKHTSFESMSNIVITRTAYRLTDKMHKDHPEAIGQLSKGHAYDMSTNIFKRLPQIFYDEKPNDGSEYIEILGREQNKRIFKYVRRDYVNTVCNLFSYKVLMPKAMGSGAFGETLPSLIIGSPSVGSTETFISIGIFNSEIEAKNTLKYIKTKFCRALLGILKTTQDITPEKWKYVPIQNFTANADINWRMSIYEIDRQLYKKYGLSFEEINFIETHVKEME